LDTDPWLYTGYLTTDDDGYATFASCVRTGFDVASDPELLLGRAFVVHANDGSRVSCGLIERGGLDIQPERSFTEITPIAGTTSGVRGAVEVLGQLQPSVLDGVCYQGFATGLERNVQSFLAGGAQCNVENGCGSHIHSGTGCADSLEQGGHYYDEQSVPVDPWLYESYYTTDSSGVGAYVGCVITGDGASDYVGRPFVVHGTDGSRLSCGTLALN
jgi:hypothetical protein